MIGCRLCRPLPEDRTSETQNTLARTTGKRHTCRGKLGFHTAGYVISGNTSRSCGTAHQGAVRYTQVRFSAVCCRQHTSSAKRLEGDKTLSHIRTTTAAQMKLGCVGSYMLSLLVRPKSSCLGRQPPCNWGYGAVCNTSQRDTWETCGLYRRVESSCQSHSHARVLHWATARLRHALFRLEVT